MKTTLNHILTRQKYYTRILLGKYNIKILRDSGAEMHLKCMCVHSKLEGWDYYYFLSQGI